MVMKRYWRSRGKMDQTTRLVWTAWVPPLVVYHALYTCNSLAMSRLVQVRCKID